MNTTIPQYLNEPEKYFIFTADELIVVVVPLLILTVLTNFLVGLIAAFAGFALLRKIKRGGNLNRLIWKLYWLMPSEVFSIKVLPRSDARLLAG